MLLSPDMQLWAARLTQQQRDTPLSGGDLVLTSLSRPYEYPSTGSHPAARNSSSWRPS